MPIQRSVPKLTAAIALASTVQLALSAQTAQPFKGTVGRTLSE